MYNFTQPHFLIIAINKSHHYVPFGLKKTIILLISNI
jgi:hypothetical protein